MLHATDRLSFEIRAKLESKGFDPVEIEEVLETLLTKKLLNDERTARELASRSLNQSRSQVQTVEALVKRGMARDDAEQIVQETATESDFEQALRYLKEKFPERDPRQMKGAAGQLGRRGFEAEVIVSAIEQHFPQPD